MSSDITKTSAESIGVIENPAIFKLSYGLFVLSARENGFDNACIINTAQQVTDSPKRISITVNKQNKTHDMIMATSELTLSIISTDATFSIFERFGFASGRDKDKFEGYDRTLRTSNGLLTVTEGTNAYICAKVISTLDCGTHTLFIADVTEAKLLADTPSATYEYYFANIKPKAAAKKEAEPKVRRFECRICGYVYEGEYLPDDFVCPLCKHGAEDFVEIT